MSIEECGRPDCEKAAQVMVVVATLSWVASTGDDMRDPPLSLAVCADHAAWVRHLMARIGGGE